MKKRTSDLEREKEQPAPHMPPKRGKADPARLWCTHTPEHWKRERRYRYRNDRRALISLPLAKPPSKLAHSPRPTTCSRPPLMQHGQGRPIRLCCPLQEEAQLRDVRVGEVCLRAAPRGTAFQNRDGKKNQCEMLLACSLAAHENTQGVHFKWSKLEGKG